MLLKEDNQYVDYNDIPFLSVISTSGALELLAINRRGRQSWAVVRDKSDGEYYYLRMSNEMTVNHKGQRISL